MRFLLAMALASVGAAHALTVSTEIREIRRNLSRDLPADQWKCYQLIHAIKGMSGQQTVVPQVLRLDTHKLTPTANYKGDIELMAVSRPEALDCPDGQRAEVAWVHTKDTERCPAAYRCATEK